MSEVKAKYRCSKCGMSSRFKECIWCDADEPKDPEDLFRPMPVDSGAWICWLLIGMLMGLLAGGVLAVWYLK